MEKNFITDLMLVLASLKQVRSNVQIDGPKTVFAVSVEPILTGGTGASIAVSG